MNERHFTLRHLKLVIVVYLIGKVFNSVNPTCQMIAAISRIDEADLQPELGELVDKRYLVENVATYGDVKKTYKLGSMGGTLMRHICPAPRN